MNWNERAEKAMDAAQRFVNGHFGKKDKPMPIIRIPAQPDSDSDVVLTDYIRESADRIAMLEKALTQAVRGADLRLAFVDAGFSGDYWERHRGKRVIMIGEDRVLGLSSEYPELAQWLEEHQEAR